MHTMHEKISKEISLGSTATTQALSFTTYDTMHAGEPTFEYSAGPQLAPGAHQPVRAPRPGTIAGAAAAAGGTSVLHAGRCGC